MAVKVCIFCQGTEWIDVDHLRAEPQNMIVCKGCGFITFKRFHDENEYHAYYDRDYRQSKVVNTSNLITTNRKIGYHEKFLRPWFKEWQEKNKGKQAVVGEIGAGIGYFLNWARHAFNADVSGSELTTSFRRYGKHAFNVDISKDFDYSKKYDLIACYHTLEHIPDPAEVLNKLHGCLNTGGALYIAVPIWMDEMAKFGGGPFAGFDDHFHHDHINAWSRWHFKSLLEVTGWQMIRDNPRMYGWTMLLTPCEKKPLGKPPMTAEEVATQLSDMQRAATAYRKGQMQEAIRLYPQFVDAYLAEMGANPKDFDKQMQILEIGEKNCPNSCLFNAQRGMLYYQYDRLDEAERELAKLLDVKPHDDNVLLHMGMIYLRKGEALLKKDRPRAMQFLQEAVKIFDKIISINPSGYVQCYDYIAYTFSIVPLDEELKENGRRFVAPHAEEAPHIDLEKERV